jgi:hypothetical protein
MSDQSVPFSAQTPLAGGDRRTYIRCCSGFLNSGGPGLPGHKRVYPGRIANLSKKGLALLLRQPFQPGTVLRLVLRRSEDGFLGMLSVNVVRVLARGNGEWIHGCVLAGKTRSGERKAI